MEHLQDYLASTWIRSSSDAEKTKEMLSQLFPNTIFDIKVDWTGEMPTRSFEQIRDYIIPIHHHNQLQTMVYSAWFRERLNRLLATKPPYALPVYKKGMLSVQHVCAEIIKIDKKCSLLPKKERDIIFKLINDSL